MLGILIDDQRNPKERATILAENGNIVKNDRGIYLVLESGSVQRHETGKRDPRSCCSTATDSICRGSRTTNRA